MGRPIKARRTRRYTNEFKATAVQLSCREGIMTQDVADALDIHPFMLSRWKKEFREGLLVADRRKKVIKKPKKVNEIEKVRKLEERIAELEKENDLLKKWQRFLAEQKAKDSDS